MYPEYIAGIKLCWSGHVVWPRGFISLAIYYIDMRRICLPFNQSKCLLSSANGLKPAFATFLNIQRDKWTYWVGKRGRLDKWKGLSLLCRKHLAGQTQRFENCILKRSCSFSKWETSFYRLPGKPWRHLTTENSLQETTHTDRLLRLIGLQHDITQSHEN